MNLASKLQENGYDIRGIRPPTVKESRLRINVSAHINESQIDSLCKKFLELV
jgi:8-amino-7-oxononanoate synthase